MKALVIYEDFDRAAKAVAALQRAAHRADATLKWDILPWRVDMLKVPPIAAEALMEAADADLIVLASLQAYYLPSWLKEWLECWVTRRQVGDAALAVMRDQTAGERAAPATSELSRFAARHGLSFIIKDETEREDQTAFQFHSSHRPWGIND